MRAGRPKPLLDWNKRTNQTSPATPLPRAWKERGEEVDGTARKRSTPRAETPAGNPLPKPNDGDQGKKQGQEKNLKEKGEEEQEEDEEEEEEEKDEKQVNEEKVEGSHQREEHEEPNRFFPSESASFSSSSSSSARLNALALEPQAHRHRANHSKKTWASSRPNQVPGGVSTAVGNSPSAATPSRPPTWNALDCQGPTSGTYNSQFWAQVRFFNIFL